MASIYGQVNPPGNPSSFSFVNVTLTDWNINIGFLGGSSAAPVGGSFFVGSNNVTVLNGGFVPGKPVSVPEGGFGGITFLVVAGLALLGRLVKK